MKNSIKIIRQFSLICLSLSMIFFFSCKKELSDDGVVGSKGALTFTVLGVEDPKEVDVKLASNTGLMHAEPVAEFVDLGKNFELEITSQEGRMESILDNSSELKNSQMNPKLASVSPMKKDKKFRILLFEAGTQNLKYSAVSTVGNPVEIFVEKDKPYDWVAYSYNDESDLNED